jgi:hypothetical protein
MKTPLLFIFSLLTLTVSAQIITPTMNAGFGVDADLKARILNGSVTTGDDWYVFPGTTGTAANGTFIIDTTGAAAINSGYATDVSPWPRRMSTFYRGMSKPPFSIVNNRLWLDALFVRDYHGIDTTVFASGSNKNGMSPELWTGGIQNVPDKNDILDMFMHVRRAGPNPTDPLWFFGALSLDQVTGNRYFDFELYQTDIYYDRVSHAWYGYGPDAGHTSWKFDASGNIISPGDIIFSASYQSSSLTSIEARIWIDRASLSITPAAFNWSGQFDGASSGSQFGYASILPKTAGDFYTGLQCGNNEWPGPFSLILQNNSLVTKYTANQFMEFSVNLTKLGLDPVTVFGTDVCGTPFNRIVVKTRSSSSFTSELKDFVAPIDLFLAPRADIVANAPILCATQSVSDIWVQNPSSSSHYSWSTLGGGNIVGSTTGPSITVDAPGTYVVTQRLSAGCSPYAYDTISISYDFTCQTLASLITSFKGNLSGNQALLSWITNLNNDIDYFEVERSLDGKSFETVSRIAANSKDNSIGNYGFKDDVSSFKMPYAFYRLKIKLSSKAIVYSAILRLNLPISMDEVLIYPNPAKDHVQLALSSDKRQELKMMVYDFTGRLVEGKEISLKQGTNVFSINTDQWKPGAYLIQLMTQTQTINKKLLIQADGILR